MNWQLHRGDCLLGMQSIQDMSIDVVITDPPYSDYVHRKSMRGSKDSRKRISTTRNIGFDSIKMEQREGCAKEFARICRRWVLVFCDVESSHLWAESLSLAGLEYIRTAAWVKIAGTPQFTGDRPAVGFEAIVIAHHAGGKHWNGGGKPGIYSFQIATDHNGCGREKRVHTTQKPEALMESLVRDFSDPGETILDPFAGSGTTGVAAIRLGRNFVGFELDEKYYGLATGRLASTREQTEMTFKAENGGRS